MFRERTISIPVFESTERMLPERLELLRYREVCAGIRGTECVLKVFFDLGIDVNFPLEISTSLLSKIKLSLLISALRSVVTRTDPLRCS